MDVHLALVSNLINMSSPQVRRLHMTTAGMTSWFFFSSPAMDSQIAINASRTRASAPSVISKSWASVFKEQKQTNNEAISRDGKQL